MSASSTLDCYAVRKQRELAYLCEQAGLEAPNDVATDVSTVLAVKSRCRAALRARTYAAIGGQTSLRGKTRFEVGGHPLESKYQRSDLRVVYDEPYAEIYRRPTPPGTLAVGAYSSCGMASITGLFMALSKLDRKVVITAGSGVYFETLYLLRTHFTGLEHRTESEDLPSSADTLRVWWLDSVEVEELSNRRLATREAVDLVVLDTTCLSLRDEALSEYVDRTLAAGVSCILLRSHLKLDCLGMEYGRLGSAVFLVSGEGGIENAQLFAGLIRSYADAIFLTGLNFDPANLFPLYADDRFHELNEARIATIRRNADRFADLLERGAPSLKVQRYAHRLFVTVSRPGTKLEGGPLGDWLPTTGLPAGLASSFGLEVLGVDTYADRDGIVTVRLSIPDLDLDVIEHLATEIARFLSEN